MIEICTTKGCFGIITGRNTPNPNCQFCHKELDDGIPKYRAESVQALLRNPQSGQGSLGVSAL